MTSPSDIDFQKAKLIKQGRADIHPDFKPLADWIYKTYGVNPIDINYTIQYNRPTLEVALEFIRDKEKFKGLDIFSYDGEKQFAIANQFVAITKKYRVIKKWGPFNLFSKHRDKYNTHDLLVAFSSFESAAMNETTINIPYDKINDLKKQVANKGIWEIATLSSGAIFFFYTNAQVEESETNGVKKELSLQYYDLLKEYDEFNYFDRESFSVSLDSKEDFDNKFNGNWYDYFH